MFKSSINDAFVIGITIVINGCSSGPFPVFGLEFGNHAETGMTNEISICHGKYASPLNGDIYTSVSKKFPEFEIRGFNQPVDSAELFNNEQTILCFLIYDNPPTIKGGPLKINDTYIFNHFNFNWGDIDTMLSREFDLSKENRSVELHVVFYNAIFYSFNEAMESDDGIVVMSFYFLIEAFENDNYNELIDLLPQVQEPLTKAPFVEPPILMELIADTRLYITYNGSLTTTRCSRNVIWMDFENGIPLSPKQYTELGTHFKQHQMKPNLELNTTIYKSVFGSLQQKGPGHGIPMVYSRANKLFFIAIKIWIIILTFTAVLIVGN